MLHLGVAAALPLLLIACARPPSSPDGEEQGRAEMEAGEPAPAAREAARQCELEIERLRGLPALPGAPGFGAKRAGILARAKGRPVLFVEKPHAGPASAEAMAHRAELGAAPWPAALFYEKYPLLRRRPELLREVVLRQGYLYTESPGLALAMANTVKLGDLFRERELWIHRGDRVLRAVRRRYRGARFYVYADGHEAGQEAHVLLLDRVAVARDELSAPLHRDLTPLAQKLGFDRARVEHLTAEALVAGLRYGEHWVPSVLGTDGASVQLECEAVPAGLEAVVARAQRRARRKARVLQAQRRVIRQQLDESLPFDEPKTEYGQQDGKLRQEWRWAYRLGRTWYEFNEDRYDVFDSKGRPRVPQVCIDFITDTLERMSGSWWAVRGQPPGRSPGRLDLGRFGIDNVRSVESFVAFAASNPDWFDVYELREEERIPLRRRPEFYRHLYEHRDRYRPGDIVTILGLRDDEKLHYHSFFIHEADPVTGMPTQLAANAGRPRIRTWDNEMSNAPRRSITARIRPRLEWLEAIIAPELDPEADDDTTI